MTRTKAMQIARERLRLVKIAPHSFEIHDYTRYHPSVYTARKAGEYRIARAALTEMRAEYAEDLMAGAP